MDRFISTIQVASLLACLILGFSEALPQSPNESKSVKCAPEFTEWTLEQLLENPPKSWSTDCIPQKMVSEFLQSDKHVENVVNCLESKDRCEQLGYDIIAQEIFELYPAGSYSPNENSPTREFVNKVIETISKRRRDLYKRAISALTYS